MAGLIAARIEAELVQPGCWDRIVSQRQIIQIRQRR